jgi:hypothetical protein
VAAEAFMGRPALNQLSTVFLETPHWAASHERLCPRSLSQSLTSWFFIIGKPLLNCPKSKFSVESYPIGIIHMPHKQSFTTQTLNMNISLIFEITETEALSASVLSEFCALAESEGRSPEQKMAELIKEAVKEGKDDY